MLTLTVITVNSIYEVGEETELKRVTVRQSRSHPEWEGNVFSGDELVLREREPMILRKAGEQILRTSPVVEITILP